jgi:hypothetical protein
MGGVSGVLKVVVLVVRLGLSSHSRCVAVSVSFPYLALMLSRQEIESTLKRLKPKLADEFHVSKIGYFGSYAMDKQTDGSDLDLLVEFSKPIGWKFFTLERFLEQSFGIPIDLVTQNALNDQLRSTILNQVNYV